MCHSAYDANASWHTWQAKASPSGRWRFVPPKRLSNTLSRFLIGIACRNQNDSIAGLFVNTDPYDSIMCRETEFQAKKLNY